MNLTYFLKIKNLKTFLISVLLILGILGFLSHNVQSNCSSGFGNGCSSIEKGIAMIFHHISEIKNLIPPMVVNHSTFFSLLLVIFAGLFSVSVFLKKKLNPELFSRWVHRRRISIVFVYKNKFLRWFSFYYKRGHGAP